jgi:hypothetical protein
MLPGVPAAPAGLAGAVWQMVQDGHPGRGPSLLLTTPHASTVQQAARRLRSIRYQTHRWVSAIAHPPLRLQQLCHLTAAMLLLLVQCHHSYSDFLSNPYSAQMATPITNV